MKVPEDVAAWLQLRDRAMADQSPGARPWTKSNFRTEMQAKPWWRSDHTWLAMFDASQIVGSVTLAMREGAARTVPVVHWLLVDPAFRRRGIARLLMQHLEQAAWNEDWREIELETHAGWTAAVAFYQSIGYEPVRDRSPR
jgi:GNAT superfamily N-acetyltransferase